MVLLNLNLMAPPYNPNMRIKLPKGWHNILSGELETDSFQQLLTFLESQSTYPERGAWFSALEHTELEQIKVVIIGQDPYHGIDKHTGQPQAHGLSFSVPDNTQIPPSLKNIFKEIQSDPDLVPEYTPRVQGNLTDWAKQGVLLLNTCLTVSQGIAGSHQNKGWEPFTQKIIECVSEQQENVAFMLWGNHAQGYSKLINTSKHLVLKAAHPSPLSSYRGFLGCQHFSKTNAYLTEKGQKPIFW